MQPPIWPWTIRAEAFVPVPDSNWNYFGHRTMRHCPRVQRCLPPLLIQVGVAACGRGEAGRVVALPSGAARTAPSLAATAQSTSRRHVWRVLTARSTSQLAKLRCCNNLTKVRLRVFERARCRACWVCTCEGRRVRYPQSTCVWQLPPGPTHTHAK